MRCLTRNLRRLKAGRYSSHMTEVNECLDFLHVPMEIENWRIGIECNLTA